MVIDDNKDSNVKSLKSGEKAFVQPFSGTGSEYIHAAFLSYLEAPKEFCWEWIVPSSMLVSATLASFHLASHAAESSFHFYSLSSPRCPTFRRCHQPWQCMLQKISTTLVCDCDVLPRRSRTRREYPHSLSYQETSLMK